MSDASISLPLACPTCGASVDDVVRSADILPGRFDSTRRVTPIPTIETYEPCGHGAPA